MQKKKDYKFLWGGVFSLDKPFNGRPRSELAHYIENIGTGTLDVIRHCQEANLPIPRFEQRGTQFVVTLWRDWLTDDVLSERGITTRQMLAIKEVKQAGRISNARYQELAGVTRKTAARDLDALVEVGVLERRGEKRGTHYVRAARN